MCLVKVLETSDNTECGIFMYRSLQSDDHLTIVLISQGRIPTDATVVAAPIL